MIASRSARALRLVAAAAFGLAALALPALAASNDVVDITIDFAKLMKVDKAVGTIVIGNPGIFDATVSDENTIVLTGKAAGATNMIILDDKGNEISNTLVRVSSDIRQLTTVFYGSRRQTFSCAPTCEQVISVGDNNEAFSNARSQIEARQTFAAP